MALDDYFSDPSQECLARLFDAANAMDISMAPTLTRDEKLIMRVSERKDIFAEKFIEKRPPQDAISSHIKRDTLVMLSNDSHTSIEGSKARSRADSLRSQPASEVSFSLGGSAVWVDEDSGEGDSTLTALKGRTSTDNSSSSSHGVNGRRDESGPPSSVTYVDPTSRTMSPKDTHFFSTVIVYKGLTLPIKMPLSTFPEEVGDVCLISHVRFFPYANKFQYSLIQLVQSLSSQNLVVSGPQHPHLHTNGAMTPPIILLFNALVTEKRIIFLGYQRPAGQVCSYVLAACALGSGCGTVMRGFISRAFPYANLTNRDEWENVYEQRSFSLIYSNRNFLGQDSSQGLLTPFLNPRGLGIYCAMSARGEWSCIRIFIRPGHQCLSHDLQAAY